MSTHTGVAPGPVVGDHSTIGVRSFPTVSSVPVSDAHVYELSAQLTVPSAQLAPAIRAPGSTTRSASGR